MALAMVSLVISGSPRSWRRRRRTRRARPRRAGAPRRRCGRTSTSGAGSGIARQPCRTCARQLVRLALDRVVERLVGLAAGGQVGLEPGDRVAQLPRLDLGRDAVLRRVVGGGVRAHPVGERLDERRPLAGAGGLERRLGHGVDREDVVAVDPHAGEAEAAGALVERDAGLPLGGLGDGPLVVLAEEHHRGVVGRGEHERLVDVTLAGRAVAEVGDDGGVALGVAGADRAVALDAHRVAGRVQRLGADDDRVEVEVLLVRVPAAVVDAAEEAEEVRAGRPRGTRRRRARGRSGRRSPAGAARGRSRPGPPPGRAGWPRCRARPGAAARSPRRRRGGSGRGRGRSRAGPRRRGRRRTARTRGSRHAHPRG